VANIEIDEITKTFESKPAVSDVSFEIEDGEFVSLLGPSGCGKTTLLRCIIGLLRPDEGRIAIGGQVMFDAKSGVDIPTEKRGLGMVFQSYALWPHLRVADNVGYPLKLRGLPRSAIDEKVRELLELVDLSDVAERFPRELSGGQQQRVALCRALASQPKLLLMDEPLSNLDAKLRERVRFEIKNVQRSTGVTILYVTHDQAETLSMSDRIGVMKEGKIAQIGSPTAVYARPSNGFVADFVGDGNVLPVTVSGHNMWLKGGENLGSLRLELPEGMRDGQEAFLVVRPEDCVVAPAPSSGSPASARDKDEEGIIATVQQLLYRGRDKEALLTCGARRLRAILNPDMPLRPDSSVIVKFKRFHFIGK